MLAGLGVAAIGLVAALLLTGGGDAEVTTLTVPNEAMEPTYGIGDEITVNLDAYEDRGPAIGDVVVFHPPSGAFTGAECGVRLVSGEICPKSTSEESDQLLLKRVVAGPGDTVAIEDGRAVLNGQLQDEAFAADCGSSSICEMPGAITIRGGEYFMLGDNRGASDDSRFWGPVWASWILGKVE